MDLIQIFPFVRVPLRESGTTPETPMQVSGSELGTLEISQRVQLVKDNSVSPNQWLPPQVTLW